MHDETPREEATMEHFNQLTPAEAERLALLAEECGEVIRAIGKVLRHGYENTHPDGGPTNREALESECGDVYHAMLRMWAAGDMCVRPAGRQIRIFGQAATGI